MPILASVYFVDVSQGISQVILFPDSSVIIIDCGSSANALLSLLESITFDRIRAVVLSHWHTDHVNGAPAVVKQYDSLIDQVYFAQDRAAADVLSKSAYQKIRELSENKTKFGMCKLVYDGLRHGRLWPVDTPDDNTAFVSVLYPDGDEEMEAQDQNDHNQGSGILMLQGGDSKILFPGDAGKLAFEALLNRLGEGQPLQFDLVAAPHHSGKLSNGNDNYLGFENCFEWLYSQVIDTEQIIVSAGTGNGHGHPRENHLKAAIRNGAQVVCTQITQACHDNPNSLALSVLDNCLPQSSCCLGDADAKGVGCAGTIRIDIEPDSIAILRLDDHQAAIDAKLDANRALCRRLPKEIQAAAENGA